MRVAHGVVGEVRTELIGRSASSDPWNEAAVYISAPLATKRGRMLARNASRFESHSGCWLIVGRSFKQTFKAT